MNNTLDLTMYRVARHTGLRKLRKLLKRDLESVLTPDTCNCELPDFKQNDALGWDCMNYDKPAKPYEPGEFESEVL